MRLAASLNLAVGLTASLLARNDTPAQTFFRLKQAPSDRNGNTIPISVAMLLAATVGFISLAYEIIWFRLYSFASGGYAPCFAKLLAFYLFGVGYGSVVVRRICQQRLKDDLPRTLETFSKTVTLGSIVGFLVGPALALSIRYVPYDVSFVFVFAGAALLGAAFPILSHSAINARYEAGSKISYIYLGYIIG